MAKESVNTRIHKKFLKEIDDMKMKRIQHGMDSPLRPTKNPRLTLAMTRHPMFSKIKQDIIYADLK